MTKSVFEEVGDALVARIAGGTFDTSVVIERSYADVNDELPDLKQARIDVVLWKPNTDLDAIGWLDYSHTYDLFIRRRFAENEIDQGTGRILRAEIDKMVKLVQDVWELLIPCLPDQTGVLTTESGLEAKWDANSTRLIEIYIRNHLKKLTQYTGLIRIGLSVSKDLG